MATTPIGMQAGIPRTWEIAGRSYQVSGITFFQLASLNDHLRAVTPHPVDRAKELLERIGDLASVEDRQRIARDAIAEVESGAWPPTFDSQAGDRYFFGTPDGIAFYLHVVLSKHQPNLSLDEVRRNVAPFATIKDLERLSVLIELITEEELAARKARSLPRLAALESEPPAPASAPLHTESEVLADPKPDRAGSTSTSSTT